VCLVHFGSRGWSANDKHIIQDDVENPFRHPQTGTDEHIGMFYAVNAGTFSDQARESFFNALIHPYGGNVRLLNGKALLSLDRWAVFNRVETIGECLTGLLEIRYNRMLFSVINSRFNQYMQGGATFPAGFRLRLGAISSYLQRPLLPMSIPTEHIENYWHDGTQVNTALSSLVNLQLREEISRRMTRILGWEQLIENNAAEIEAPILNALNNLGQLTDTEKVPCDTLQRWLEPNEDKSDATKKG
jgi:hypothetical protein